MTKNPTHMAGSPRGALRRFFDRTPNRVERGGRRVDERGSSLILALVYIVSVSLIVGALADWAMNDLNNTSHFQNASLMDNAVSGATEVAIQSMRYNPFPVSQTDLTTSGFANCWSYLPSGTYASDVTINKSDLVAVWCSTAQNLKSPNTRVVTFIACPETAANVASGSVATAMGMCQSRPTLKAVVTFDDYPSGGGGLLTQTCIPPNCGYAATTNQWTWA